ncbi:seed maturation protein pm25-like protein [Colletotrichum incanum]|uniref:Seed maturation protein pm25-like protein n=1 Tax=Colletotrichum incanum TaxID=1573173 RepID=A0A167BRT1_COLIC|nr:seed maturation protein pm25-like protein [Colletotrichum incanum]
MAIDQETVQHLADNGHAISNKEVSEIAQAEKALTGNPVPAAGGLAATAQSLRDKQQNFLAKEVEIEKKPESDITNDDAKKSQSAEARLLGHRPPAGSVAAHTQSIANKNEKSLQSEVKEGGTATRFQEGALSEKEDVVTSNNAEAPMMKDQPTQEGQ